MLWFAYFKIIHIDRKNKAQLFLDGSKNQKISKISRNSAKMIVSLLRRVLEMKKNIYLFGVSIVIKKLCLIFPSSVHELKVGKSKHNDSKPLQK